MSAISQIEKEIREAVVFLRENNQTIPSATIQFMKDASIEKLNQGETLPIDSVSGCPFEAYAVFCIECDRQGIKPIKYKDYLEMG